MLKPKQMSRLFIAASRDQMTPVVAELYRHHLFHIEEYVEGGKAGYEGFKIGTPLPGASEVSVDLLKIRAIENAVSINADDMDPAQSGTRAELKARIERELPVLANEVEELTQKRGKFENRVKEFEQKIAEITPFADIAADLSVYRGYRDFTVYAGYVAKEVSLSVPNEMQFVKGKEKNFVVIVAPSAQKGETERALQEAAFQSVQIPDETGFPKERISYYLEQVAALNKEIAGLSAKLDAVRQQHAGFMVACEEYLRAEAEQSEAPLRFATTKQTFVAEGWVPSEKVGEISAALVKATGGRILVEVLPTDPEHDNVPVEYNNPDFAKPAQMLMDIYSRPKYTEVDPTLMLAIVFPIFFGLILGDVGYGLILLVMWFFLRKMMKGEDGQMFMTVLRNACISSIIFGVLFNEFLGFELTQLVEWASGVGGFPNLIHGYAGLMPSRHLLIGSTEPGAHGPAIPILMMMAIWIGILHITLGRVLGMYNHAKQDHGEHRMKAVMANFGWLAVMWGILVAIWSNVVMPLMPDLTGLPAVAMGFNIGTFAGAALILAGVLFIARESVLEVIELPTIISHVLSYARLVAVGLSSVAIAMVTNYMSIGMFINPGMKELSLVGIVMILVGLVIFLLGHALNTALGILGGGLHSIRLHYVEFFTKFYKGGGMKYVPFGMKRRFTEE
ncbi:V-type ATP synthase subunit I [Methanoregula formicica]|uniref:A-type ATP synthase subunit I n=1 Tax=Methanoregula formicica (strain DSM 22288 / NBRC 105244 / SMSP) TaxID=593750 RepID=L0H9G8_METFS|nr:V-type ATP synthase subunit I [Methanoregula formicica]AGB01387.1 archaeal/vacuolar-type H+-ATPase subunit I [Methanoregula formicica SMSP]